MRSGALPRVKIPSDTRKTPAYYPFIEWLFISSVHHSHHFNAFWGKQEIMLNFNLLCGPHLVMRESGGPNHDRGWSG